MGRGIAQDFTERHYNAEETRNITISNLPKDGFTCLKLMITNNMNFNQALLLRAQYHLGFSIMHRQANKYDYNLKTLKKKELLEKMGYIYIYIPYYDSNHLRGDNNANISYTFNI